MLSGARSLRAHDGQVAKMDIELPWIKEGNKPEHRPHTVSTVTLNVAAYNYPARFNTHRTCIGFQVSPCRATKSEKRGVEIRSKREVETRPQLILLIRLRLRRPTFAGQRVPPSQIFGLPVLRRFAPRL